MSADHLQCLEGSFVDGIVRSWCQLKPYVYGFQTGLLVIAKLQGLHIAISQALALPLTWRQSSVNISRVLP